MAQSTAENTGKTGIHKIRNLKRRAPVSVCDVTDTDAEKDGTTPCDGAKFNTGYENNDDNVKSSRRCVAVFAEIIAGSCTVD